MTIETCIQFKGTLTRTKKFGSDAKFTRSSVVMWLSLLKEYDGQPHAGDTCNELVLMYSN
jgi:hypothetical protein